MTFTDVTQLKPVERLAKESKEFAESIVQTVRHPLVVLDADLRIRLVNPAFLKMFKMTTGATINQYIYDLGDRQWDIPQLRTLLGEILPARRRLEDFRVEHEFPHLGRTTMLLNASQVTRRNGAPALILLAIENITSQADTARNREEDLARLRDELKQTSLQLLVAEERERRRIARDLHDDLLQKMGMLEVQLETLERSPPANAKGMTAEMHAVRERVTAISNGIRVLSHRLHPAILEDLGLKPALRSLVQEFWRLHHSKVHLTVDDPGEYIPLPLATVLYRIVQEALRNAAKHVPGAAVTVRLSPVNGGIQLRITNSGPGFDLQAAREKGGLGLINMQERVQQAGGRFEIQSSKKNGTRIVAFIPLD